MIHLTVGVLFILLGLCVAGIVNRGRVERNQTQRDIYDLRRRVSRLEEQGK